MDLCMKVLKESNKTKFDSYSVRNSVLIISHITFRDCRVHSFSENLSPNNCIQRNTVNQADEHLPSKWGQFLKTSGSFNMLNTREAAIVQANDFHKLLGGSRSLVNWETPLTITHSIFMSCAATKTPTTNSEQIVNLRRQHKKIKYFSLKLFLITEHFKR